ncbi:MULTISPECIES: hypothetical protein [unclassified Mycobacterium]|uniref:hypothetical protein n=1 Tax=unclassified Mycobacterium TaxID=2642494 RepID=UPI0007FF2BC8|nr:MULTISPECIES: hypothetical protein [unclassified Mycobacterium]OBG75824.1 hypothetical protein A5700_23445 [Mycobacterium sp. E1214]OBH31805.1 hypothetical protein A5693_01435 [Mycobacterium sp. E1319]
MTSPADAFECAEALLHARTKPGGDIWAAQAVGPLAAMLYAASPCGNNEGIRWLMRATATLPDPAPDHTARVRAAWSWRPSWHGAIAHLGQEPVLSTALRRALEMDPRQRESLLMTMRDALSPWARRQGSDDGE